MSIGILIVTHGKLGRHFLETVQEMIGPLPLAADVLEVERVQSLDALLQQGTDMLERLGGSEGVLVLTDAYGSTPSNIATRLPGERVRVVAGLNLPMLLRVFNYAALPLEEIARAAVEGGRRGVTLCERCDADARSDG